MLGALGIDAEEVLLVQTLRNAGGMDDVVEAVAGQLLAQGLLGRQVQLDEMDAFVGQKLVGTALAHSCPHLKIPPERLLHNERPDEAARSRD